LSIFYNFIKDFTFCQLVRKILLTNKKYIIIIKKRPKKGSKIKGGKTKMKVYRGGIPEDPWWQDKEEDEN